MVVDSQPGGPSRKLRPNLVVLTEDLTPPAPTVHASPRRLCAANVKLMHILYIEQVTCNVSHDWPGHSARAQQRLHTPQRCIIQEVGSGPRLTF